jgi:hypothetical protein
MMDEQTTAELINSFNDGFTGHHITPALSKARQAWLLLDESEREIFKGEILSAAAGSLKEWPA